MNEREATLRFFLFWLYPLLQSVSRNSSFDFETSVQSDVRSDATLRKPEGQV